MKALVLAGGFPQIALINELRKHKATILLADYNDNPVAKEFADKYYQVSTLDVQAIKEIAIKEKVDFLITVCTDQALLTVASVSEELHLPCYIDYETARNVTNKQYMKKVFAENKIPSGKHIILEKFEKDAIQQLRLPLVVKPVDCNSSKGVHRCDDMRELEEYFVEATRLSRTGTAIVEEYITGEEISVDVYVENGKAILLCMSESDKIADKDKFVIFRSRWPSFASRNPAISNKVEHIAQQIADVFHIVNSPMLIQLLVNDNDVYVIEFSARTGGGDKHLLIKRATGFDVVKAVVDLTLGIYPHVEDIKPEQQYLVTDFIYCHAGIFDHLEGFDELKEKGVLKDFYLFKTKGTKFDENINSSGDRIAGYTVTANSHNELISKHDEIRSNIKIISRDGNDMARHDLLYKI